MQVRARLQDYRVGARKARLVADLVRGRGVEDALTTLEMCPKRVARPLAKLVRSAVAFSPVFLAMAGAAAWAAWIEMPVPWDPFGFYALLAALFLAERLLGVNP